MRQWAASRRSLPPDVARRAARKLEYVELATQLDDLKVPPGNRLHALDGDRKGRHAIAVNDQWRTCFRFVDGDAWDVEICDFHQECEECDERQGIDQPAQQPQDDAPADASRGNAAGGLPARLRPHRRQSRRGGRGLPASINELLRGRRAVSPEMALRLSRLFGKAPEFWLNAQRAVDLWDAAEILGTEMARIQPLRLV